MAEPYNPLSTAHAAKLDRTCAECARIKAYLDRLQRAGLPVETQRKYVEQIHERALALKKEFFPELS